MSETQPGSFGDLRPADRAEEGRDAGAIERASDANGRAMGRRIGRHPAPFVCGSRTCGCRPKRPARSAHAWRSDAWSGTWEARIWRALRRRRATVAQLAERLARTRLRGFGTCALDPAFLAAVDHLLVTGQVRWARIVGRQRAKRLEVVR